MKSMSLYIAKEPTSIKYTVERDERYLLDYFTAVRTLHHNIIELGHFFAATALQLLSYFA